MFGVGFEVVGHFIAGRKRVGRRWKRHPDQRIEARWSEQAQRVPTLAPGVADAFVGVQDYELQPAPRQIVTHGQTRLPAAHDDHVEAFPVRLRLDFAN